jgi:hypothetical protein
MSATATESAVPVYVRVFRVADYRTANVNCLEDFIDALGNAADHLEEMWKTGKVVFESADHANDHVWLTTTDPKTAQQYGFRLRMMIPLRQE